MSIVEPILARSGGRRTAQALMQKAPESVLAHPSTSVAALTEAAPGLSATGEAQGLSKHMSLGRAALAVVAGLVLFFVMGPRALKFAAKGAGTIAKALVSPKAMTNLVHKGMMLFGMLEAALPIARSLGLRASMPPQLAALAQRFGGAGLASGAAPMAAAAPLNAVASMAASALPQAGQLASNVIRQSPPAVKQQAQVLLNGLANVVHQLKSAATSSSAGAVVNPLARGARPV